MPYRTTSNNSNVEGESWEMTQPRLKVKCQVSDVKSMFSFISIYYISCFMYCSSLENDMSGEQS